MFNFFTQQNIKGFSLVEILVVLGLFSSIATLSLASLFNAQSVNRRLQETQSILDNINLSTQTVTRDIRFGTIFYATSTLPTGDIAPLTRRNCLITDLSQCTILIFKSTDANSDNDRVAYYVTNGVLYKTTFTFGGVSSTEQMTSNDVRISSIFFSVDGAQTSDGDPLFNDGGVLDYKQPLVTFLLSGLTRPAGTAVATTTFNFETNISPRELDSQ